MRTFDYSFLKNQIPGQIVSISNVISDLNAKETLRRKQNPKAFDALKQRAIVESVKGSNAIEGIVTTDDRILDLVKGAVPVSHDEKEISGYKDALSLIHDEYRTMDITVDFLLQMHRMITGAVSVEEAGKFKKNNNLIMEYTPDGKRRVRFRPVEAAETPDAIEQLILAYMDARQDGDIPILLVIPCLVLDFLCIHPFSDGNGRVSRLLTIFLLYKHGYDIGRYISIEQQINKYREAYYEALEKSSLNWHRNENDYTPFMINFMQILYRCYKELDDRFIDGALHKAKKSERVRAVVLNSLVPISKQEIAEKVPDISVRTVELVLGQLQKKGEIKKIGSFRDARYMRI